MYSHSTLVRCIPLLGYLTVFLLAAVTISLKYEAAKEHKLAYEKYEVYVTSAYYYNRSKSLGDASVALILVADFEFVESIEKINIIGENSTGTVIQTAQLHSIPPHKVCRWVPIFVTTPLLHNLKHLSVDLGISRVQIPFQLAITKKHNVVTCIAPLFANENWQLALISIHTYKHYGSHLHIYIRSMISPLFDLLRIYEKEGFITIDPWLRIKLSTISQKRFNPNLNVEFRNQAGAQTDCLLKYKESADFISFMDLDDILIPRLGSNYFEEFTSLFNSAPYASFIHYVKENVEVDAQKYAQDFNLYQMLSSIRYSQQTETGKMVTKPEYINYTWIHWPDNGLMPNYKVPSDINSITHLKKINLGMFSENGGTVELPYYEPSSGYRLYPTHLLEEKDRLTIEQEFQRIKNLTIDMNIFEELPPTFFYSPLIADCYERTFYSLHNQGLHYRMKCPGPERCYFPESPGLECQNAESIYSSADGELYNIHYHQRDHFELEDGCSR
ncbi:unnamed protein product [Auanema sp. JU1783]|nr:unnamed protein product [Auanema sp. JU1783]